MSKKVVESSGFCVAPVSSESIRSRRLRNEPRHEFDRAYLDRLDRDLSLLLEGEPTATTDAVARSVEIKAEVVSQDEREAGLREVLNFGHTLGHGLEAAADYRLAHGSAVATRASGYQWGPNSGPRFQVTTAPAVLSTRPIIPPTIACAIGLKGARRAVTTLPRTA